MTITVTKEFVLAGKATFTLELPESFRAEKDLKPHYTFRVEFSKAKGNFGDTYFVKLLTGPENTSDYTYLGILNPETGAVRATARSVFKQDHIVTRLLNRTLARVWEGYVGALEAAGFDLHHEGRCGRCNRLLTTPESVTRGLGPECWGKVAA